MFIDYSYDIFVLRFLAKCCLHVLPSSPISFSSSCTHHYNQMIISHYNDVIMDMIASQITSLTIVYSTVYSDANQRKHNSSASLAFVRAIHRGPVNSPHKWPVTRKMFQFDNVIMCLELLGMFVSKTSWYGTLTLTLCEILMYMNSVKIWPWGCVFGRRQMSDKNLKIPETTESRLAPKALGHTSITRDNCGIDLFC